MMMASLREWLPGIALSVLLLGLAAPALAGETLDRVLSRGVMVMSTDPDYPPQSFRDSAGEFRGFDVDVGREIAERLGVDVEFVTPSWEAITAGSWNGRWDVSIGSMVPTPARAKVLDFPAVYYYMPAALAVDRNNAAITTPSAVSGRRIGVGAGTVYESYLKKDLTFYGANVAPLAFMIDDADIATYDSDAHALADLARRDGVALDAVLTALPKVLKAIKDGAPLRVVGAPLFREPRAVATDQGDEDWNAQLATFIATMREDGALKRLSERWYGIDLSR
jgi:polar amino acid transport system substrate-binding protein